MFIYIFISEDGISSLTSGYRFSHNTRFSVIVVLESGRGFRSKTTCGLLKKRRKQERLVKKSKRKEVKKKNKKESI